LYFGLNAAVTYHAFEIALPKHVLTLIHPFSG
jgi:hypothetical protein